ncbi:MAG: hypothetical protein ACFB22_14065 [Rhodothalassiaceae bacterium]
MEHAFHKVRLITDIDCSNIVLARHSNLRDRLFSCGLDPAPFRADIPAMPDQREDKNDDGKAARLAEALRANLRRRKTQARKNPAEDRDATDKDDGTRD